MALKQSLKAVYFWGSPDGYYNEAYLSFKSALAARENYPDGSFLFKARGQMVQDGAKRRVEWEDDTLERIWPAADTEPSEG